MRGKGSPPERQEIIWFEKRKPVGSIFWRRGSRWTSFLQIFTPRWRELQSVMGLLNKEVEVQSRITTWTACIICSSLWRCNSLISSHRVLCQLINAHKHMQIQRCEGWVNGLLFLPARPCFFFFFFFFPSCWHDLYLISPRLRTVRKSPLNRSLQRSPRPRRDPAHFACFIATPTVTQRRSVDPPASPRFYLKDFVDLAVC